MGKNSAEQGKCSSCKEPPLPGETRCQKHKDEASERSRASYQRRKKLKVCAYAVTCTNPPEPGRTCCRKHLDYQKGITAKNRDAYAPRQRELAKNWYDEHVAAKVCPECNARPARPNRVQCGICAQIATERASKGAAQVRLVALAGYGLACALCGEEEIKFLQIDHEEGGGNAHRREIGQSAIYRWLINNGFPRGFRTLCASCNFERGLLVRARQGQHLLQA